MSIVCSERNGAAVSAMQVSAGEEIMLVTDNGTMIRTAVEGIPTLGRNTQGVRLIRTNEAEKVIAVAKVVNEENETDEAEEMGQASDDERG
nr:DNA gyrase C-terminal beta-propeller domain-containing protein [Rappaport israeli]